MLGAVKGCYNSRQILPCGLASSLGFKEREADFSVPIVISGLWTPPPTCSRALRDPELCPVLYSLSDTLSHGLSDGKLPPVWPGPLARHDDLHEFSIYSPETEAGAIDIQRALGTCLGRAGQWVFTDVSMPQQLAVWCCSLLGCPVSCLTFSLEFLAHSTGSSLKHLSFCLLRSNQEPFRNPPP